MKVEVAYAAPGEEALIEVHVGAGAVVADAMAVCGLVARLGLDAAQITYAIHGQRAGPDTPLRQGDRIEIVRPLVADPKTVRRHRALAHPVARVAKPARHRR